MEPDYKPRLRPMTLMRTQVEGKKALVIQDPQGVGNTIALPADFEDVVLMMNGEHTMRDIQERLIRQFGGQIVPMDDVIALVNQLDANMILDSERFHETIDLATHFWRVSQIRKPFHAGTAYEKDRAKLIEMLDGFYDSDGGPGRPKAKGKHKFVEGLLAPHIDVRSGGKTFAWAYRELMASPKADLYVVFGTAHHMSPGPFSLSLKDYMTPLGIAPTDRQFSDELLKRYSPAWLTHDSVHKSEHSIEFQIIFLLHALKSDSATVLPVLAGFHNQAGAGTNPWEDGEINSFLDALKATVAASGKKVTYIVGGDLAHIGPRYGDDDPVIPADLDNCSKKDHEMLDAAAKGGAKAFYDYIAAEKDCRNICGMSPLYAMLYLLDSKKGELLHYDRVIMGDTQSAVSFASMVWK